MLILNENQHNFCELQFLQHHDLKKNVFNSHDLSKIQIYVLVYLPSGDGL